MSAKKECGISVKFVRQGQEPSKIMMQTFEEASDNNMWVAEEECLNIKQREKKSVFIFEHFSGDAYENIITTGNRIYGPMCILTCMRNSGDQLPKVSHPVYSLAMRGLIVSCTSVEREIRESLHQKIKWMCGEVSKDFSEQVTHLVAGEVGSKKYLVAANLKRKIMSPEWVEELWEATQVRFVHGDDQDFSQYACPVFKGFVITVSGLETSERAEVKELVEKEGGRYTGEMKINECTHLIVKQAKGQKYEFARKWKIHIVSPKWLFDSADSGYCQEEHRYRLDPTNQEAGKLISTSTPTRNRSTGRVSNLPDVSAISMNHVNETAVNDNDQTRMSYMPDAGDVLDNLNLSAAKADMFLDGCKIFLTGFLGAKLDKFRRIINIGGATRFNQINENVTHVVMGDQIDEHVKQLQQANFRPSVVNYHWLVDCFKQRQHLSEDPYICMELAPLEPASPIVKGKLTQPRKQGMTPVTSTQLENAPPPPPPTAGPDMDMQDLMSQYLPGNNTDESALIRAAEMGEAGNIPPPDPTQDDDATQDPNSNTQDFETQDPTQDDDGPLFAGKTMVIVGFSSEDEQQLISFIEETGGQVLGATTRRVPDYAIVPVFGCQLNMTAGDIVTNAWLQMCIEQEEVLPIENNELFTPLVVRQDDNPLDGCVLSISGYAGTERDTLMHIAEACGAKCQEYFVKKANRGLEPSTHLVVNAPEGSKYNAAKKWHLPAVTKHWLFECARSGKRLPESQYSVDNPPKPQPSPKQSTPAQITNDPEDKDESTIHEAPAEAKEQSILEAPAQHEEDMDATTDITLGNQGNQDPDQTTDIPDNPVDADQTGRVSDQNETAMDVSGQEMTGQLDVTTDDAPRLGDVIPQDGDMDDDDEDDDDDEIIINMKDDMQPEGQKEQPKAEVISPGNKENVMGPPALRTPTASRTPAAVTPAAGSAAAKTPLSRTPLSSASASDTTPRLANNRVKTLIVENQKVTPRQPVVDKAGIDTPSKFLGPNTVFQPKFNLTDALSAMDTPVGQASKSKRRSSLPLEELFKHHIAIAVKKSSVPGSQPSEIHQGEPEVEESVLKQAPTGPLQGVMIAVSKKLTARQSEYNNIASALGAEYCWTYDDSCTHFIFQGRNNDMNKEFRKARDKGKIIVSPHWLLMCKEQNCLVDESLFPHTYNPNMSLSMETPGRSTRRSTRHRTTKTETSPKPVVAERLTFEEPKPETSSRRKTRSTESAASDEGKSGASKVDLDATQSDEDMAAAVNVIEKEKEKGESLSLMNNLKNLMANTKSYKGRRRSRRNDSTENIDDSGDSKRSSLNSSRGSKGGKKEGMTETQHDGASQMVEVSWDDPTAREQQVIMASELAKNSESFSPTRHFHGDEHAQTSSDDDIHSKFRLPEKKKRSFEVLEDQRIPTPEAPALAFPIPDTRSAAADAVELMGEEEEEKEEEVKETPRVFLLSGMVQQERDDYGALIEELGGQTSDAPHYDNKCTHLVVGNPTRNEKYLACVASGKWVLHKSYLEACRQECKFVCEEDHEWGNDGTAGIMSSMSSATSKLAKAAHRWRVKMQGIRQTEPDNMGAFGGWQVVLITDPKREDGFRRLLEAGGATVAAVRPPVDSLEGVTHAFMDLAKANVKIDVEMFVKAGVMCLKPEYIASYLMDDPSPQPKHYYPTEVQQIMKSGGRKRRPSSMSTPSGKKTRHQ